MEPNGSPRNLSPCTNWFDTTHSEGFLFPKKILLYVWWTAVEIVHCEFLEKSQTNWCWCVLLWTTSVNTSSIHPVFFDQWKESNILTSQRYMSNHKSGSRKCSWTWLGNVSYLVYTPSSDYHLFLRFDNCMTVQKWRWHYKCNPFNSKFVI